MSPAIAVGHYCLESCTPVLTRPYLEASFRHSDIHLNWFVSYLALLMVHGTLYTFVDDHDCFLVFMVACAEQLFVLCSALCNPCACRKTASIPPWIQKSSPCTPSMALPVRVGHLPLLFVTIVFSDHYRCNECLHTSQSTNLQTEKIGAEKNRSLFPIRIFESKTLLT